MGYFYTHICVDTLLLSHLRRSKQKKRLACIRIEMHQKKYFVHINRILSCFSRKQKQKSTKTNFTKEKVYPELA